MARTMKKTASKQAQKDPKRVEAAKKAWETRRSIPLTPHSVEHPQILEQMASGNKERIDAYLKEPIDGQIDIHTERKGKIMDTKLLKSKVKEINSLHSELIGAVKMTLERAIRIGGLLIECKEAVGFGNWIKFVKENCNFSQGTAENYVNAFKRQDDPKFLSLKNLENIYYPQLEHKHKKKQEVTSVAEPQEESEEEVSPVGEELEEVTVVEEPVVEIVPVEGKSEEIEIVPEEQFGKKKPGVKKLSEEIDDLSNKVKNLANEMEAFIFKLQKQERGGLDISTMKFRLMRMMMAVEGLWKTCDENVYPKVGHEEGYTLDGMTIVNQDSLLESTKQDFIELDPEHKNLFHNWYLDVVVPEIEEQEEIEEVS